MTASKLMILQPLPPGPPQGGSLEIKNGAYSPLRQFLTEYLVAWAFASQGDEAVLYGGHNPMFDIAADPDYVDVKSLVEMSPSEQAASPGYRWKLNTGNSGEVVQYPVEQTNKHGVTRRKTHMALVRLDPDMRFGISVTSSGLQITAEFRWALISYAKTTVVNDWINDEPAQYAYLEETKLDAHHYAEIRSQAGGPPATTLSASWAGRPEPPGT
jgi:hypothetical protein